MANTESYPHMCRDGHQQIGHLDSEHEKCPLCRAAAEIDRLTQESNERLCVIRELRAINVTPGISLGKSLEWKKRAETAEAEIKQLRKANADLAGSLLNWDVTKLQPLRAGMEKLGTVNQRLTDLVRYQRHELFGTELITPDEFAALVQDNDHGRRVARLEGYDDMREKLMTFQATLATQKELYAIANVERTQLSSTLAQTALERNDLQAAIAEQVLDIEEALALVEKWMPENSIHCKVLTIRALRNAMKGVKGNVQDNH